MLIEMSTAGYAPHAKLPAVESETFTRTVFPDRYLEMHRIMACRDCVLIAANGEPDGDPADFDSEAWNAGVERNWPAAQGWSLGNGWSEETDCEPWFSWQACEGCGCELGGDREYMHVARDIVRPATPYSGPVVMVATI